jgi:hypothetical protein
VSANAVLATVGGALALHQLTAVWDVAYAEDRRDVARPFAAIAGRGAAPYAEEIARCYRAERERARA